MQQMIQQNAEGDERRERHAAAEEARRTAEKKEREVRRTAGQKERDACCTAQQKEHKTAQTAQLAILSELKQKLAGVSKRMDGMETQQQAGAQTQSEQQDELNTFADWQMQQEQALQQLPRKGSSRHAGMHAETNQNTRAEFAT